MYCWDSKISSKKDSPSPRLYLYFMSAVQRQAEASLLSLITSAASEPHDHDARRRLLAQAMSSDDVPSTAYASLLVRLSVFGSWDSGTLDSGSLAWLWHLPPGSAARKWWEGSVGHLEGGRQALEVPHILSGGDGADGCCTLPESACALLARASPFMLGDEVTSQLWAPAMQKWGDAAYLRAQLDSLEGGVHVLGNLASRKDFSYFKDASDEFERPACASVRMRVGDFLSHRGLQETRDVPLLEPPGMAAHAACLYLQNTVLSIGDSGALEPPAGLGPGMVEDIAGLDMRLLRQFQQAGRFGQWRLSQLFVGTRATVGARSTLHIDQNDNLFVQIAGTKRLRLFPPTEGGNLYAYPVYHSQDRRAQVDLQRADDPDHLARYPRLAAATSVDVEIRRGQLLFLPAYWWHEVVTEAVQGGEAVGSAEDGAIDPTEVDATATGADRGDGAPADGLSVSVNFWFEVDARRPLALPLAPATQLEFARQLESLTATALGDAALVPSFFGALVQQWRQLRQAAGSEAQNGADSNGVAGGSPRGLWPSLHDMRPAHADAMRWQELFEYVSFKLCLMLGATTAVAFLENFCDPVRFGGVSVALEA